MSLDAPSARSGPTRSRSWEILPDTPLPYWGWGDIPDQYRRRWDDDDGESPQPRNAGLADLPPLRPHWGPAAAGRHDGRELGQGQDDGVQGQAHAGPDHCAVDADELQIGA
jgi:hypothetical protein